MPELGISDSSYLQLGNAKVNSQILGNPDEEMNFKEKMSQYFNNQRLKRQYINNSKKKSNFFFKKVKAENDLIKNGLSVVDKESSSDEDSKTKNTIIKNYIDNFDARMHSNKQFYKNSKLMLKFIQKNDYASQI